MKPVDSEIELAVASEADVPLLVEMVGELAEYENRRHEVVLDPAQLAAALVGRQPLCEALIARCAGEPAGFAIWFYSFSTFQGRKNLYIEDLFVRPAFRRRGVGREIIGHLARLALQRQCGRLEWSVLTWNEPALEFYRRLGARPVADWQVYQLGPEALAGLAEAHRRS
jgi:GNAT superfamily N-acetyltransferase